MADLIPRLVESLRAQSPPLGLLLPAGLITYLASHGIYNILFHPLRAYPGPFLFRLTGITKTYYSIRGNLQFLVKDLHDIYGPVVRLGPSELSFAEPAAFKDIYGHRLTATAAGGRKQAAEFPKLDEQVRLSLKQPNNILNAPSHEEHTFLRKKLAPGFSDRSMRAQEPIINGYVDLLIKQLRARAQGRGETTVPAPVDMMDWFSWTTFDIIGNLGFGSDFASLQSGKGHPWVINLSQGIVATAKLVALKSFGFGWLLGWLMDSDLVQDFVESRKYVQEKVNERLELKNERPDFLQGFIEGENSLPFDHITSNAAIIILAGSESTSTALTGTLYLLLSNPDKLAKVTREIRTTFSSEQDISLSSVQQQLPYLLACLDEALRCYPPVTTGMARVIPDEGGAVICGRHVPKDTAVAVWQWVVNHDAQLWHDPYAFHPERFLRRNKASNTGGNEAGDDQEADEDTMQFANDNLEALMPFHTGPRNCIGKSLAYAEMRLIISRLLYAFDISLADDKKDWISSQRAYFVWDKQPLMVNLRCAQ